MPCVLAGEYRRGRRVGRIVAKTGGTKVPLLWRQAETRVKVTLGAAVRLQPNRPLRLDILMMS